VAGNMREELVICLAIDGRRLELSEPSANPRPAHVLTREFGLTLIAMTVPGTLERTWGPIAPSRAKASQRPSGLGQSARWRG